MRLCLIVASLTLVIGLVVAAEQAPTPNDVTVTSWPPKADWQNGVAGTTTIQLAENIPLSDKLVVTISQQPKAQLTWTCELSEAGFITKDKRFAGISSPFWPEVLRILLEDDDLQAEGKRVVKSLVTIPGITDLEVGDNLVNIQIGPAFNWAKIQDQIIAALKASLVDDQSWTCTAALEPAHIAIEAIRDDIPTQKYHVNRGLSTWSVRYLDADWVRGDEHWSEGLTPPAAKAIETLLKIKGITSVSVAPYWVEVKFERGGNWKGLENQVRAVIKTMLR